MRMTTYPWLRYAWSFNELEEDEMGNYKILRKLGEGGNSVAFQALDKESGAFVTIKKVKTVDGKMSKARTDSLENEARILAGLDNESIPKLIEKRKDMVVLQHFQGMSLEKVMALKGLFEEKKAVSIALEISDILRYLHGRREPVIYRDLKPSNIILKPDGHVALIDFGAARYYDFTEKSDTQNIGTVGFAAPEQFGNLGQTDPRTDIYCLGITLLQILTGVNPQDGDAIADMKQNGVRGVSNELMQIIDKCTRPDRDDRFKSIPELKEALLHYPKVVKRRRIAKNLKNVLVAAVIALVLTCALMYADRVKSYAAEDMDRRMPFVKQRLSNAHVRIEEYLEQNLGVEIE